MTPYLARINILIAQRVYGWTNIHLYSGGKPDGVMPDGTVANIPDYAGDIDPAWAIVERVTGPEGRERAFILTCTGDDKHKWFCDIGSREDAEESTYNGVSAPTAPLAICLACLKHLGIPLPETEGA